MKDERKTKAQLIEELKELRRRLAELTSETVAELRGRGEVVDAAEKSGVDLYRLLVEHAPVGVLLADTGGNLKLVNEKLVELLGSPSTELTLAINLLEFQPLVESGFSGLFKSAADGGETLVQELSYRSHWGRELEARVQLTPILNADDRVEAVLGLIEDVSRVKLMERALEQTEHRYETLLDLVPDGVVIVDEELMVGAVNDRALEILGRGNRAKLLGTDGLALLGGREADKAADNAEKLRALGRTRGAEYELRRPDGETIIVGVRASVLGTAERPAGYLVILRDLTDYRRAEERLRRSEERLREVVEGAELGYWDWDIAAGTLHLNERWASMLGYSLDEVEASYEGWRELVHPEDLERVESELQRHLDGESEAYECEYRMRSADGGWSWILSRGKVRERDVAGQPLRAAGIHQDVGKRRRAELERDESRRRLQSFVEKVPDVLYRADLRAKRFEFLAPSVERMLGYPYGEVWNDFKNFTLKVLHPDDRERVEDEVRTFIGNGPRDETLEITARMIRSDGRIIWVRDSIRYEWDDEGLAIVNGVMTDITSQVETEQSYRALVEEALVGVYIFHPPAEPDDPGRFMFVNDEMSRITGYSKDELLALDTGELTHPDDHRPLMDRMAERLEGREVPSRYTMRIRRRDGRTAVLRVSTRPITYRGRQAFLGNCSDVTETVNYEEELQSRVKHSETLADLSGVFFETAGREEILSRAADLLAESFPVFVSLNLLDAERGKLVMAEYRTDDKLLNFLNDLVGRPLDGWEIPLDQDSVISRTMTSGRPTVCGLDFTPDEEVEKTTLVEMLRAMVEEKSPLRRLAGRAAKRMGAAGLLGIPFIDSSGRIVGSLTVLSRETFGRDDYNLAKVAADQIGRALEQHRLNEELRASEERFRSVFSNVHLGVYRTTPDGRILLANQAMVEMMGFTTLEELLDHNLETNGYQPQLSRADFKRELEERGEIVGREYTWTKRDGRTLYVRESARAVRSPDGTVRYYEGTVEDLTERRRTEQALADSEEQYRLLAETADDVIIIHDIQGRIIYTNPAGVDKLGYTAAELIGSPIDDYLANSGDTAIDERRRRRRAGEQGVFSYEREVVARDDRRLLMEINSSMIEREGEPWGILLIARDITERRSAELELERANARLRALVEEKEAAEERYRSLQENLPLGVYRVTPAGEFIEVNDAFVKLFGFTDREELFQRRAVELYVDEERRTELMEAMRRDGVVNGFQARLHRADGQTFWVSIDVRAVRDAAGEVVYHDGILTDISAVKRAETVREVLFNIANAINTCESTDELYPLIHRNLSRIIDTTNFFITLYDREPNLLVFPYYVDSRKESLTEFPAEQTVSHYVIRSGETLLADDEVFDELIERGEIAPRGRMASPRVWLGAPLKRGDEVFGVVAVQNYDDPRTYDEHDRELLETVSSQIANAVDKLRTERALRDSENRFRTLYENMAGGVLIIDEEYVIRDINEHTCQITGYDRAELVGEPCDIICPKGSDSGECPIWAEGQDGFRGMDTTIKCRDGRLNPILKNANRIELDGRTYIIENFQDISDVKRAETVQDVLFAIANSINTCERLDDLYPIIHRNLARVLETTNFFIALFDESSNTLRFPYFADVDEILKEYPAEKTLCHYVVRRAEAVLVDSAGFDELAETGEIEPRGDLKRPRVWLGAPLKRGDEVFGVVAVQSYDDDAAYNDDDRELLQLIAHQIANAVDELQAEQALRESEERFRRMADNISDGLAIIEDGRVVYVNERLCEILQRERAEIEAGLTGIDIAAPDEVERLERLRRRTLESGEPLRSLEFWIERPDGERRCIHNRYSHSITPDGVRNRYVVTSDITERKLAERALRESEDKFRLISENSLMGILILQEGVIRYANRAMTDLTGYTPEELLAWEPGEFARLIHPQDRGFVIEQSTKKQRGETTGIIPHYSYRGVAKDGRIGWIDQYSTSISYQGAPAVLVMMVEITEQKRAEEALQESERFNRAVVEHLPLGVSVRTTEGRLILANEAWRRIWAVPEDELARDRSATRGELSFDERDHYLGDWRDKVRSIYSEGGYLHIPELAVLEPRPGGALWVSQHFYALTDADGVVNRVVILTEDITERKLAEEKEREYITHLSLLTETALDFVRMDPGTDIFAYLARRLCGMLDNALVTVSQYDARTERMKVRSIECSAAEAPPLVTSLCNNPELTYELPGEGDVKSLHGELEIYPFDDNVLKQWGVPDELVEGLAGELGVEEIASMGLVREGVLYGMVDIILLNGARMTKGEVVETFLNQASVALQRTLSERALAESREALSQYADNVADVLYRINLEQNRFEFVSPAVEQVLGYGVDEVMHRSGFAFTEVLPAEEKDAFLERLRGFLATGPTERPLVFESRLQRRNGELFWARHSIRYEWDDDGRPVAASGILSDITERKRTELELADSEERFRRFAGAVTDTIYRFDIRRQAYDFISPSCERLTGYTAEEFIEGAHDIWRRIIHPDDIEMVYRKLDEQSAQRRREHRFSLDYRILHKDGRTIWVNERGDYELDENGEIRSYNGVIRDISETREAEAALAESERTYRSLYDTTLALADERELSKTIAVIAEHATNLLGAEESHFFLLDHDHGVLRPIYTNNAAFAAEMESFELPLGTGLTGLVAQSGRGRFINAGDPELEHAVHLPGTDPAVDVTESLISVPVFDGERVSGVLTLGSGRSRFDDEDLQRLTVFARQAEIAVKRARYLERLAESEEVYRSLYQTTLAVTDKTDLDEVLEVLVNQAGKLLKARYCTIYRLLPRRGVLQPLKTTSAETYDQVMAYQVELGRGLTGTVARTGVGRYVNAGDEDRSVIAQLPGTESELDQYESLLCEPILDGDEVSGVLTLSKLYAAFDDRDQEIIRIFVHLVSLALRRAENVAALRESEQTYRRLYDTTLALADTDELEVSIRVIAEHAAELIDAAVCIFYRYDEEREKLVPIYTNEPEEPDEVMSFEAPLGMGLTGRVAQSRRGAYSNYDEDQRPVATIPGTTNQSKTNSLIAVPISDSDELLGVMTLIAPRRRFTDEDLNRLGIFSRQAEIAVKRARYLNALAQSEQTYRRLYDTTLTLADTDELATAAEAIAHQAKLTLESHFCIVFLYEADDERLVPLSVDAPAAVEELKAAVMALGEGLTGRVARDREGAYVNYDDPERKDRHVPGTPAEDDERQSTIAEPIMDGENLLGAVTLGTYDRRYDDDDLTQLRVFARLAAIAVKRNQYIRALAEGEETYRRLYETTLVLADNDDLDEVVAVIGDQATQMLDSSFCIVYTFDEDEQVLRPLYTNTDTDPDTIYSFRLKPGEGLVGRVAVERRGAYDNYNDPERKVVYIEGTDDSTDHLQSIIAEPITDGDRLLGVLSIGQVERVYNEADLGKLRIFARMAAVAILRTRNLHALAESEEKHRTLVEQATDGVIIVQDGLIKLANTAMAELSGFSIDELVDTPVSEYIDPADIDKVMDNYRRRLNGESDVPHIYEIQGLTRDGKRIPLELNAGVMTYLGQRAVLVLVRDITERLEARESIRQLNSTLRALRNISQLITVEKNPAELIDGACEQLTQSHYDQAWIVLLDDDGDVTTMAYRSSFDKSLEESGYETTADLPLCLRRIAEAEDNVLAGNCDDCPLFDNGKVSYLAARLEYGDRVFGYLSLGGIEGNVPEREERELIVELANDLAFALYSIGLERSQAETERRSRYYVEHISEGVWCFELEPLSLERLSDPALREANLELLFSGICVECNDALAEMYLTRREELLGRRMSEVFPRRETLREHLQRFLDNDCRLDNNVFGELTPAGEQRWFIASMFGEIVDERLVRLWGRQLDITEQRRAEAERDRHRREVQAIFDNMDIMLWSMRLDDEGYLYYEQVNRPFAAVEGRTPDFYNGERIVDIAAPEQVASMRRRFEHIADGTVHSYELDVGAGENRRAFDIRLIPLPEAGGEVRWFIGTAIDVTRRKQALEALRESEEKYRAFTEEAMIGVYILSGDEFIFVNHQMEVISGYPAAELLRMDPVELAPEADRGKLLERRRSRGTDAGLSPEFITRLVRKDGEIRNVEIHARPITLEGKTAILGNLIDITERRRAQQALAESEERYRSIWNRSPIGICLTDRGGDLTMANPALCGMLGYDEDELIGSRFYDLLIFADDESESGVEGLLSGKLDTQSYRNQFSLFSGKPTELVMRRKDGGLLPVEFTVDFISREGSVRYMIALITDITERKRAEEARANYQADLEREVAAKTEQLSIARRYLRDVLDSSGELITVCDAAGNLEILNRTAASLTGYDEDEVLGEHISLFYYQKDLKLLGEIHKRMTDGGGTAVFQVDIRCQDGSPLPVELSVSPLHDENGDFTGSVGIARNLQEIEDLRKALLQSEKLAAIGKLAASIAHEVNNPLGVIKNYLQIAKLDLESGSEKYRLLGIIEEEVQRIVRIIQGLLNFYRPESTTVVATDINRIIEDLLLLVGIQLEKNDISVEKNLAETLPPVIVAPDQFRQIMLNLVTNAQDAMPDGGVLGLGTAFREGHVIITVSDTGHGIAKGDLPNIFDPFFTTKGQKGTGLGLSISYGLIKSFDGEIEVDSRPGQGSTFTIHLPSREA